MFMVSSEELLNILGNETRRTILELLAENPRYTTEIASILEIGQKAINEHLRIMSEFGVIEPYVQKQPRGSPRKYFKINERFKLEFTLTPGYFQVYILDSDMDMKSIMENFPEFKELQRKVEQIENIRRIEHYRRVYRDLGDELSRLRQAKMYVESLMAKVRQQCLKLVDGLDLDVTEKRVLFEIVTAEGEMSVSELAEKSKLTKEVTIQKLRSLEEKGVVRL
jgi:ArsR family transcriptional regulator